MGIADLLARFDAATKAEDPEELHRLRDMIIRSVHLVSRGANRRNFAVRKGEEQPMLTNDIIGLEITKTADGLVTAGKAHRDQVAAELSALAKKLSDPEADEEEVAASAKKVAAMLAPTKKASKAEDEEEMDEEAKAKAKKAAAKADEEEEDAAKAKKAKEADEEEAEKAKKAFKAPPEDETEKAKKAKAKEEEEETAKRASKSMEDQVSDAFALISKAGRRMSTGRLSIFKEALSLLQKLAEDLDPEEQKKVESFLKVAKSLTGTKTPEVISAGNGAPTEVAKSDTKADAARWTFGMNINNPDLHRETADPTTSFFDKK